MARPIKAVQKEGPIGYQSVTVRLPQQIIEALNKLDKGRRAEFIRNAINDRLKQAGINGSDGSNNASKAK